jgi:hypothetical protein
VRYSAEQSAAAAAAVCVATVADNKNWTIASQKQLYGAFTSLMVCQHHHLTATLISAIAIVQTSWHQPPTHARQRSSASPPGLLPHLSVANVNGMEYSVTPVARYDLQVLVGLHMGIKRDLLDIFATVQQSVNRQQQGSRS